MPNRMCWLDAFTLHVCLYVCFSKFFFFFQKNILPNIENDPRNRYRESIRITQYIMKSLLSTSCCYVQMWFSILG